MEMIKAKDLYYLERIKTLEFHYNKCKEALKKLQYIFDSKLDSEHMGYNTILELNSIFAKISSIEDLMEKIKERAKYIKLSNLN